MSATDLAALAAFKAIFQKAVYEYFVSANLARHFRDAGLKNICVHAFLANTLAGLYRAPNAYVHSSGPH
jgi:hypothetical protein